MTRLLKWLMWAVLALVLLLAAVAFALHRWVGSDDFRERLQREAGAALGVPVVLGSMQVDVWPLPAVALGGLTVQSQPPVTLERLEVRPQWQALLRGEMAVTTLVLRKAVLPQKGIDAILLAMQKKKQVAVVGKPAPPASAVSAPAGSGETPANDLAWLPRRTILDDVTWISNSGTSTAIQGEARLGADGLPDSATLKLIRGNLQGLSAKLQREARPQGSGNSNNGSNTDQWALLVNVGGGRMEGKLGLQRKLEKAGAELVVQGKLETRDVEVSALTAPNKPLSGKLEASTTLNARAATTDALVEALQTQTSFTVRGAVIHGIDLAKAVKTVGMSRGGQTELQTLAGHVATQGRAAQLSNLVASSGILSAAGNVAVSPAQALSGHVSVNLSGDSKLGSALGGAVAVPLVVSGTLQSPEVTLSRSALVGAAIGTALMPGVGTGAGAKLGSKLSEGLGKLFGK
ncbi:MAG: AsmA family protein [Pseudomonadota bacterium]